MTTPLQKSLIKITIFTSIFVLISMIIGGWINAFLENKNTPIPPTTSTNEETFRNVNTTLLGRAGVAISTNLWTRFTQINELPANIYSDVMWITEGLQASSASGSTGMITRNMILAEEYRNVLRTDIMWLLAQGSDRARVLDAIISQLEYRYELAVRQMRELLSLRNSLETQARNAESQIDILRNKMAADFAKNDAEASYENIHTYLDLKARYNYSIVYIVYINQFLNDYNRLNDYNKRLLDTLINNRTAIVKDAYVVIPSTGIEFLREFKLLLDEAEHKARSGN